MMAYDNEGFLATLASLRCNAIPASYRLSTVLLRSTFSCSMSSTFCTAVSKDPVRQVSTCGKGNFQKGLWNVVDCIRHCRHDILPRWMCLLSMHMSISFLVLVTLVLVVQQGDRVQCCLGAMYHYHTFIGSKVGFCAQQGTAFCVSDPEHDRLLTAQQAVADVARTGGLKEVGVHSKRVHAFVLPDRYLLTCVLLTLQNMLLG